MLHIAILINEGQNYNTIANSIIDEKDKLELLANTSLSALKEMLKARIRAYPEERWLMLSGNTIAESAAPPISFRQW